MDSESVELEYTQCLQDIDRNFVRAIDAGSRLLKNVQTFDSRMRLVSENVSIWSNFFTHVETINTSTSSTSSSSSPCKRAAKRNPGSKPETAGRDASVEIDSSSLSTEQISRISESSSGAPPTPKLPKFSKSFAKTPMGRKLASNLSNMSEDDDSFALQHSPDQPNKPTRFQSPQLDELNEFDKHRGGRFNEQVSPALQASFLNHMHDEDFNRGQELLDISGISPATPSTPQDGDYGPTSQVKAEKLRALSTTPAKLATQLMLSSGIRHGLSSVKNSRRANTTSLRKVVLRKDSLNDSDASSNPATPTLNSPMHTIHRPQQSQLQDVSGGDASEEEEELLVGYKENDMSLSNVDKIEKDTVVKNKRDSLAVRRVVETEKRSGTPLSNSIAKKRMRSLPSHLRESNEELLLGENEDQQQGTGKEDLQSDEDDEMALLDESYDDSPPPEFSLDLFPKLFQTGEGATQVTGVYSRFSEGQALSLEQLSKQLPDFSVPRLELMLEMLVSRSLLRPFRASGTLFWRLP